MASLKINLISETEDDNGKSERSEMVIANSSNVIPNQALENSPLLIKNTSTVPIYLLVVYELKATKNIDNETVVIPDDKNQQIIDIGVDYINEGQNIYRTEKNSEWTDYIYVHEFNDGTTKTYRCLISAEAYTKGDNDVQKIEVIPENHLKLSRDMGNEYQEATISFIFQAFAIGTSTVDEDLTNKYDLELGRSPTKLEKCKMIIEDIYAAEEYHFFETAN